MKGLSAIALVLLMTGCSGSGAAVGATDLPSVDLVHPPQSAYAALVRTVEVLDAVRTPGAHIRLRAVECKTILDRDDFREYVRVVLEVTVFAELRSEVLAAYDDLTRALEAEAAGTTRQESVAYDRVVRVFQDWDWTAPGVPHGPAFAEFVSISRSIRVDVERGTNTQEIAGEGREAQSSVAMASYIRDIAGADVIDIGEVSVSTKTFEPYSQAQDLRYHLLPADPDRSYSIAQLGDFLYWLEASSPGVRVTEITIEPFAPGADVREDSWKFATTLTVRVSR